MTAKGNDIKDTANDTQTAKPAEPVTINTVHTYPDGTQVVGTPPFPARSPKDHAPEEKAAPAAMHVPNGVPTSGAPAPETAAVTSPEVFQAKVEQQLASDVASGKSPDTPNPTTASDKPVLGNIVRADDLENAIAAPQSEDDLKRIAEGVRVKGDYSDEQKEAAVIQVARETAGPIPDGKTAKKAK